MDTLVAPKIIISGPPGSGRGTQCEYLRAEFNVIYFSSGEMLRVAVEDGSDVGKKAKVYMDRGQLVPDKIMNEIVLSRLAQQDCIEQGWILDGYPRTGSQAKALLDAGHKIDAFIILEVPDHVLIDRIIGRRTDPVTGKIYNLKYSPPEDEDIVARLVKRSDDSEDKVKIGIQIYRDNLPTILEKVDNVLRVNGNRNQKFIWNELRAKVARSVKYIVVFVLGGPGSGKGTQCSKISLTYGYVHLSAGDLLREERARGSELAGMINDFIVQGKIVPAEITIKLIANAMKASGSKKFLIDGFPRNMENMEAWYNMMDHSSIVDFVLFFDCPEAVMTERLLERGKTSGRSDDNITTIIKRFHTFQAESMPVMRAFQRLGKVRIVSSVPSPEVVFKNVARFFNALSLVHPFQRTLGIIKPDAVADGHVPAILDAIASINLTVICTKFVVMTDAVVTAFYADIASQGYFRSMKEFMTSGPSLVVVMEGTDAVKRWRNLLGPTNSMRAKQTDPDSVRARFGTNGTRNACHGSDSERSAIREISFWLDPKGMGVTVEVDRADDIAEDPVGLPLESTLAIIKPIAADTCYEEIMSVICGHGFSVTGETKLTLTDQLAESFYAEHLGKPFFPTLKAYMTSGICIAIRLERHGAIKGLRHLMGYTNVERARIERPDSLRALFGLDGTRNAVHGSDSATSALREVAFFFTIGTTLSRTSTLNQLHSRNSGITTGSFKNGSDDDNKRINVDIDDEVALLKTIPWKKKSKLPPTMSLSHRGDLAHFLEDQVDPIVRGLVERILIYKPKDVLTFAIQDLTDIQRLTINNVESNNGNGNNTIAPGGINRAKLEPLTPPTKLTVQLPTYMSPTKLAPLSTLSSSPLTNGNDPMNNGGSGSSKITTLDAANKEINRLKALLTSMTANIKEERKNNEHAERHAITPEQKSKRRELIILHFNDIYEYEATEKEIYGGAARLSWQVKNLRGENPLLIHSGDFLAPSMTSNVTKGAHMVQIMNCIGVNYGVIGNHDFDFGVAELKKQLALSSTTWICSNLVDPTTLKPIAGCERDAIFNWNGVAVGLLGLVENWLGLCPSVKASDAKYLDIFQVAADGCAELRRKGAEVVIAITHCRTQLDEELSRRVSDIDLVLGGHDHYYSTWKEEGGTYGVKSGCDFRDLTKIRISIKENSTKPKVHWPPIRITIGKSLPEDREVREISEFYHNMVVKEMNTPIGYTDIALDGSVASVRCQESNLGNLVTDLMKSTCQTDIAILNGGFIRSDSILDAGFITLGDIARFFPFPDILTSVELSGSALLACLENGVSRAPAQDGRFCHVSGIKLTYDVDAPQKHRCVSVLVNGMPLDKNRTYTCALNGFLAGGNEGYKLLKEAKWRMDEEFCPLFYSAVVDALTKMCSKSPNPIVGTPKSSDFHHIRPQVEGRVSLASSGYESDDAIGGEDVGEGSSQLFG